MEFTLDSFKFHFPWFNGDYQLSPRIMNYRGVYCCGLALFHGLVLHMGSRNLFAPFPLDIIVHEKNCNNNIIVSTGDRIPLY